MADTCSFAFQLLSVPFFTVRWSAFVIPAVSLQRIPGYQHSNTQHLSFKTQLYTNEKHNRTPTQSEEKIFVDESQINNIRQDQISVSFLIYCILLSGVFLSHWQHCEYVENWKWMENSQPVAAAYAEEIWNHSAILDKKLNFCQIPGPRILLCETCRICPYLSSGVF